MATESVRPSIVWFRQDLPLADNPALAAAVERGRPIIPVVLDPAPPATICVDWAGGIRQALDAG